LPSWERAVPEVPARPASLRVGGPGQPIEGLPYPRVITIPELDQGPDHVARVARMLDGGPTAVQLDAATVERSLRQPVVAGGRDLRNRPGRTEVGKREQVPAC